MEQLTVDLGDRSYPILIAQNLLQEHDLLPYISGNQAVIVTNETVAPLYLDSLIERLEGLEVETHILPDGEKYKSMESLSGIFDTLINTRQYRTTTMIALGGGVVGDMTGFAAASYQRGVNFIQVPTTLLAQVDSSVGGKTGVNHPSGKNMIGAFHQPKAVFVDTQTLCTLPDREFSAGMAEVIKYGFIADISFLGWLEENLEALMARDARALATAIRVSCETKAKVVAADEREKGLRAILNLGHTFGHAIEAAQSYSDWLHGEAIAAGMVMAAEFSKRLGLLSHEDVARVEDIFVRAQLPIVEPSNIGTERFLQLMGLDKKVMDGRWRLVLLKSLGEAFVTADFPMDDLEKMIAEKQTS